MNSLSQKAKDIFVELIGNVPPDDWDDRLVEASGGNRELLIRVRALLRAHAEPGSFLEEPAVANQPDATLDQPITEKPGTQIGSYKLLQQLGEGGMGVVFLAEQTEPVQRRVALKLIKAGMDSRQIIARFETEKQALALMDHANIARVLDAGTTKQGRPYFVMELVHGVPITTYCDDNHLAPRERLELFVPVCQAIQHAHQKGIIHRDIKPSNVLVSLYDGKPVPKVIDLGVAKATEQKLTEQTMFTEYGTLVGTLEYMSPEQAEFSALGVDTRSDIFSLGVLLYELLTGSTPLKQERMKGTAYAEILRMIKEEEPPRPSMRLSGSGEVLASISAQRHMEPAKLSKLMRGELDWIVMKCLEKDRNRRYDTANGFAIEIQRYLNDEPVEACPPSAVYRFRKFARRNKGAFAAATVLSLALLVAVGAITGTLGYMARDRSDRQSRIGDRVDLIMHQAEQLERDQMWPEALNAALRAEALIAIEFDLATSEWIERVVHDLKMVARLEELRLEDARIDEQGAKLDEGRPQLYAIAFREFGVDVETLPVEETETRLSARPVLAVAYAAALDDWARTARRRDLDQSKRLWNIASTIDPDPWRVKVRQASTQMDIESLIQLVDDPNTARQPPQSLNLLASSLKLGGQLKLAVVLLERASEVHPDDFWIHFQLMSLNFNIRPARLEEAISHGLVARALRPRSAATWSILSDPLQLIGKFDEANSASRKAIELDSQYPYAYTSLGNVLFRQNQLDGAIEAYRKAIELDPSTAAPYIGLGNVFGTQMKPDEATTAYHKALELNPKYALAYSNLGKVLRDRKQPDEAIAAYRKALELDPQYTLVYRQLGSVLRDQNMLDEAISSYQKALELNPKYATAYSNLGVALSHQHKLDEAIEAFRKLNSTPERQHPTIGLGNVFDKQMKPDEAITAYRKAIELNPKDPLAYSNLGITLQRQKKLNEAIAFYCKASALDPNFFPAYSNLGIALIDQNKQDEAVVAFRKATKLNPQDAGTQNYLGIALSMQQKTDEAITAYGRAIELDPKCTNACNNLSTLLKELKRPDEVIAAHRRAMKFAPKFAADYLSRGSILWRENQDVNGAIAVFEEALRLQPDNYQAHFGFAVALVQSKQWDRAATVYGEALQQFGAPLWPGPWYEAIRSEELFARLTAQRPNDHLPWIMRARLDILQGDWKRAEADYVRVSELLASGAQDDLFSYAGLLLLLADHPGYEQFCQKWAAQFGPDQSSKYIMPRACIISLHPVVPPQQLVERGKKLVQVRRDARHLHVLSLAHYRNGEFDLAIEYAKESNAGKWRGSVKALNWLALAMAHHCLGQADEARTSLEQALFLASQPNPDQPPGVTWPNMAPHDAVEFELLRREAEPLLNPVSPESDPAMRVKN
ncbi:MAG: tetratricopeptide repeat protein [Pirellulaceae bacterium]|nr:tetratricopeptide repeat protein [Pirellulaceae bacterium]